MTVAIRLLLLIGYVSQGILPPPSTFFMITEDGERMITEDGDYMITE